MAAGSSGEDLQGRESSNFLYSLDIRFWKNFLDCFCFRKIVKCPPRHGKCFKKPPSQWKRSLAFDNVNFMQWTQTLWHFLVQKRFRNSLKLLHSLWTLESEELNFSRPKAIFEGAASSCSSSWTNKTADYGSSLWTADQVLWIASCGSSPVDQVLSGKCLKQINLNKIWRLSVCLYGQEASYRASFIRCLPRIHWHSIIYDAYRHPMRLRMTNLALCVRSWV